MEKQTTTAKRYPRTDEQRQHMNEYQRRYRAANKDRVRQWRVNYALKLAARIAEQAAGASDGWH